MVAPFLFNVGCMPSYFMQLWCACQLVVTEKVEKLSNRIKENGSRHLKYTLLPFSYFNSTSISISTGIFPGRTLTPIALRAGFPADSPNSSMRSRLPPFATCGCWVKESSLATKASTFTKRLILFRSPVFASK